MNEVKQAWTSLLSSRTLMTSGTAATANSSTGNHNSSNGDGNSTATWYDAPAPVIIHNRKFIEQVMDDTSKVEIYENKRTNGDDYSQVDKDSKECWTAKRKISKDSGIETIASLRRTFLDEFRRSNEENSEEKIANKRTQGNEEETKVASRDFVIDANSRVDAADEQVLYQNNVEAALNSLSKVCAEELLLNSSVDSTSSSCMKNSRKTEVEEVDGDEGDEEEEDKEETWEDDTKVGKRRRKRTASSGSRRHSSSVELTAMTSVTTGDDGMPTISFSFLRSEENSKPFIRDIPLGDENPEETSAESSNQLAGEQLYDFPKSGGAKRVTALGDLEKMENKNSSKDSEQDEGKPRVALPERRFLGDGSVAAHLNAAEISEDQLYDFPKRRSSIKIESIVDSTGTRVPRNSVSSDNEEQLYDSPTCPRDLSTSTWNESIANSRPENEREIENEHNESSLDSGKVSPRNRRQRNYRSLRSGRSIGTIDKPEVDNSVHAYYSDPECQEAGSADKSTEPGDRRKDRKHHRRRLGKAWGKMRTWLREEKSRIGEVVNRHAKMQAVGALKGGKSEDGLSSSTTLGSRSGSYDLIEARTRELGSITRVEEFGLSSVSEEGNVSDPERAECTSYDLHHESSAEVGQLQLIADNTTIARDNGDDDEAQENRKKSKLDSSKDDQPDGDLSSRRLRKKTLSTDNVLGVGTRMKLTPVSFSLDKLCADEGNNEGTNTGHRDNAEQTRDHGGKGGLIKRRMLGSIRGLMASTHLLQQQQQQHESEEGGPGGFEDVRRYVKQGGDFCKELAAILHERAELEASYSKGLSKLSGKLTKACTKDQGGNGTGGVTEAWRSIGEEMEAAAEAHRAWGIALSEQLAKPLRVGVAEAQGRSRKAIESSVDKASKSLQEWRGIAAKSKKQSFSCARENERLQDLARIQSISQSQQNNNKTSSHHMTEKEVNKLETRRRKAEDSSRRADTEFYTVSVRAERARLEYESTVRKGAKQMELLDEERLSALKDLANVYLAHLQALAPRLQQSADRLSSPVRNCSVSQEVDILKNVIRRLDSNDASNVDQLLPDFYAEHVTLAMNRERRKQSLVRVLHLIRQDLERERRGREGLETLHRAFIQTPAFAADESTQNVTEKLHHMRSMLTFLEAARYKVGGTLAEVEGGKRGKHPLAEHILVSRDKQGLQQSVLKVPSWAKNESFEFPEDQDELELHLSKEHDSERRDWVDRTAGDGNSENPPDEEDFSDFDEFSSQSEDNNNQEVEIADITEKGERIEQCTAIYQYSANLNDELSLTPGDLITIHEKQADGWWIGECGGRTGIFPATYVQIVH